MVFSKKDYEGFILVERLGIYCEPKKDTKHPCEVCELANYCISTGKYRKESCFCIHFDKDFMNEHPEAYFVYKEDYKDLIED